MKAVRMHAYGGVDQLVYEEVPGPVPGPGEALIRVQAVAVNPVDWKIRAGYLQQIFPMTFPAILGTDVAGIILSSGGNGNGNGNGFHAGDRVIACLDARQGGAYAELVVCPLNRLVAIPAGMDSSLAASLAVPGLTGTQLVEQGLAASSGKRILITGAIGAVGRIAVQMAARAKAEVFAGVRSSQAAEASKLPVRGVIALDDPAALKAAAGTFDGVGDTVGGPVGAATLALVSEGGRFVTIAGAPPEAPGIQTQMMAMQFDRSMLQRIVTLAAANQLSLAEIQELPLQEAARAHQLGESGGAGKLVLVVN
jgi:NADPH:quinone reductase-like Zn-dependent oxidoreductase